MGEKVVQMEEMEGNVLSSVPYKLSLRKRFLRKWLTEGVLLKWDLTWVWGQQERRGEADINVGSAEICPQPDPTRSSRARVPNPRATDC